MRSHLLQAFAPLLVLATALLHGACGGCESAGGDATRVLPETTRAALIVPAVGQLREQLVTFLAGVEGTQGVLDLVRERYGVDLSSVEGLRAAGVDPAAPLAIFQVDDAVAVALGVASEERFLELVRTRVTRFGGADAYASGDVFVAVPPGDAPAWRAAWGVTDDHIGLVVGTLGDKDPALVWQNLADTSGGFLATDTAKLAREAAGPKAAFWFAGNGALQAPEALGFAGAYLTPTLRGLTQWHAHGQVEASRLALRIGGLWPGEGSLPSGTFSPQSPPAAFAEVFPKASTVLLRTRVDLSGLASLPSFLRDRFIPKRFPRFDDLPLPAPADLLNLVTGDICIALMGVDEDATVSTLMNRQQRGAAALQLLHVALAFQVGQPEAAQALLVKMRTAADASNVWTVADIKGGGWSGVTFVRDGRTYSALLKGDVLVFVTGAGEVQRFLDVGEGRATALTSYLEADPSPATAVLTNAPPALGAFVTFSRITRELADKGVPPYFLKMINDIHAIGFALSVSERRVDIALDVTL